MSKRLLGAGLIALLALATTPPAGAVTPDALSSLAADHDARQVVIVSAESARSTRGSLTAYEQDAAGRWRRVMAATPARLGGNGLVPAAQRRQLSNMTPMGTFAITSAFGRKSDPGTELDYVHIDRNDAWTYDPARPRTYNVFQTADRSWDAYGRYVEHLWSMGQQYDYVAVLDFNLPTGPISTGDDGVRTTTRPADTRRGGGIFLHVTNGRATAGCIAISESAMARALRWIDPAAHPIIVIGLRADLPISGDSDVA